MLWAYADAPQMTAQLAEACAVHASLFKKPPVGLSYTVGLEPTTARFPQAAAWDAVQDDFKP